MVRIFIVLLFCMPLFGADEQLTDLGIIKRSMNHVDTDSISEESDKSPSLDAGSFSQDEPVKNRFLMECDKALEHVIYLHNYLTHFIEEYSSWSALFDENKRKVDVLKDEVKQLKRKLQQMVEQTEKEMDAICDFFGFDQNITAIEFERNLQDIYDNIDECNDLLAQSKKVIGFQWLPGLSSVFKKFGVDDVSVITSDKMNKIKRGMKDCFDNYVMHIGQAESLNDEINNKIIDHLNLELHNFHVTHSKKTFGKYKNLLKKVVDLKKQLLEVVAANGSVDRDYVYDLFDQLARVTYRLQSTECFDDDVVVKDYHAPRKSGFLDTASSVATWFKKQFSSRKTSSKVHPEG